MVADMTVSNLARAITGHPIKHFLDAPLIIDLFLFV